MSDLGWGTWIAERPAELRHLSTDMRIMPVLYSSRASRATFLPPGQALGLGPRSMDGKEITFATSFEDTLIEWRYLRKSPQDVSLDWRLIKAGEWGLRYWILICVRAPSNELTHYDEQTGVLSVPLPNLEFTLSPDCNPAMTTIHDSVEDVAKEIESRGYFYLASRGTKGKVAALRYNLEQTPELQLNASISATGNQLNDTGLPNNSNTPGEISTTRETHRIRPVTDWLRPPTQGTPQSALQAVHDVISWNHAYDDVNHRPYTLLSRFWNRDKFGGFGVWLDDILFNGLMWSQFESGNARENFEAVAVWQTDEGNFPCLVTGNDAWLDRSQIPVAAYVAWHIYTRTGDRAFLARSYPRVARNHEWWQRRRRLGDTGFIGYGTSKEVGKGLYKGTRFAAQNESSMDNSPVHDVAPFNEESGMLQSIDVGLNSLFALDAEVLGYMARELQLPEQVESWTARHRKLAARISRELWDEGRSVFANRLLNGKFVRSLSPISFYPMVAGAATKDQARILVDRNLEEKNRFGGRFGLPSVAREDPAFGDNVYWRGRIWGPMNFWTYLGLRRYRMDLHAKNLARKSQDLFDLEWSNRLCGENYNADSGRILDQSDSDTFYSWGALLPLLAVSEVVQTDPWDGLSLTPSNCRASLGPILTKIGKLQINCANGFWMVELDDFPFLSGNIVGRIRQVSLHAGRIELLLPVNPETRQLHTPNRQIISATLGDPESRTTVRIIAGTQLEIPPLRTETMIRILTE